MLPDVTLPLPASLASLLAVLGPLFTARRSVPSVAWPAGSSRRPGSGRCAGCWPGRDCRGCGRTTGRTGSSPAPAGIPMTWAWLSPGWWWRCWCRPGSRWSWRSMTPCSGGAARRCGPPPGSTTVRAGTCENGIRQQLGDRRGRGAAAGGAQARGHPGAGQAGHQGHPLRIEAVAGPPDDRNAGRALPGRHIRVVADSAYAGGELKKLPAAVTWTTRLRKDAALHGLPPARTGRRGRPRTKGDRLPSLTKLAATTAFTQVTVTRYGKAATISAAAVTLPVALGLRHPAGNRRADPRPVSGRL